MGKLSRYLVAAFRAVTGIKKSYAIELKRNSIADFASANQGRNIIMAHDDYIARLSPFDRSARMKTSRDVSQEEFVDFIGRQTLEWTAREKERVAASLKRFRQKIAPYPVSFPEKVMFVKTTGKEEGGAAYTRSNAVFLPQSVQGYTDDELDNVVFHELFHVLTRANPALQEQLYAVIGFKKYDEVELPLKLQSRKITNPDAPINRHAISVRIGYQDYMAVPVIFSEDEKFDPAKHKNFFDALKFKLLLVAQSYNSDQRVIARYDDKGARLLDPDELIGFFEQIGRNTSYIIHPEEVLADNFVHMLMGSDGLPDPEVVTRMKQALNGGAPASAMLPPLVMN